MNACEPLVFAIFRTTLLMSAAGILVWLVLRRFDFNSFSRVCWLAVLMIGWLWLQVPCSIPWYEPPAAEVGGDSFAFSQMPEQLPAHFSVSQTVGADVHEHVAPPVVAIANDNAPRWTVADVTKIAMAIWCLGLLAMLTRLGISSVWYWRW